MAAYGAGIEILSGKTEDQECRIIDIGCGEGEWLKRLASRFERPIYIGIDILPEPIDLPTAVQYIQADKTALPLPFPDHHFLLVHCRKLLSSLEGEGVYITLLNECVRVLAPGGMVAIVEGRNARTEQVCEGRPADLSKGAIVEKLRKEMLIRKGLDTADLSISLPSLMKSAGLRNIQIETLQTADQNEERRVDHGSSTLASDLDGNSHDALATNLTVFSGWKPNQASTQKRSG